MPVELSRLRWPQVLALGTGLVLTLWGLAGFAVTGFADIVGQQPTHVLGLRVNPLQNMLHVVTGLALVAAAPKLRALTRTGLLLAMVYLVLSGVGAADDPQTNVFNVNVAGNVSHLLAGFASLTAAQGSAWCRQCTKSG